jgi:hypothetical protein
MKKQKFPAIVEFAEGETGHLSVISYSLSLVYLRFSYPMLPSCSGAASLTVLPPPSFRGQGSVHPTMLEPIKG